jgi:hypothetical protein
MNVKNWPPKVWIGIALIVFGFMATMGFEPSGDPASDLGYSVITMAMLIGGAYLWWTGGRGTKK